MAKNKKAAKKKPAAKPAAKKANKAAKPAVKAKAITKAKPAAKLAKPAAKAAKPTAKTSSAKAAAKPAAKPTATARATAAPKFSSAALEKLLTPLDDRILIEVEGASDRTAGGIYIPGSVTAERPNRGRVLAKGRGKRLKKGALRPLDVSVGDVVIFPKFAGTEVELEGNQLLILREEELLGISE